MALQLRKASLHVIFIKHSEKSAASERRRYRKCLKSNAKTATELAILVHEARVEDTVGSLGKVFAVWVFVDAREAQLARLGAGPHDVSVASTVRFGGEPGAAGLSVLAIWSWFSLDDGDLRRWRNDGTDSCPVIRENVTPPRRLHVRAHAARLRAPKIDVFFPIAFWL